MKKSVQRMERFFRAIKGPALQNTFYFIKYKKLVIVRWPASVSADGSCEFEFYCFVS